MRRIAVFAAAAALLAAAPAAAAQKATQFWNLTAAKVVKLEIAPAGTTAFGPDQCVNDPDGSVDHDERLKLTGLAKSGAYDLRIALADGRKCMARAVHIEMGKPFSVEEKDLVDCAK